jgi:very-short-patch-repair endonuclease
MLSHASAAWWWGLTDRRPQVIDVSTPRQCVSLKTVRVHGRRALDRVHHKSLPVTTVPQTLLDYARNNFLGDVRYVLAEADYHRLIDLDEVRHIAGRGKPGSTRLKQALAIHWPELALTRSRAERAFLLLCEEAGLPRPQVNVKVHGMRVDAYWPDHRLVVEIDGIQGHSTERQLRRDHARDLTLRSKGETVRRYTEPQILIQGDAVLADLLEALTS